MKNKIIKMFHGDFQSIDSIKIPKGAKIIKDQFNRIVGYEIPVDKNKTNIRKQEFKSLQLLTIKLY